MTEMNFPLPLRFGVRAKSPHCKIVGENKMTLQLFHTTVAVRKTQKMRWVLQHVKKIFPSFLSAFDVFIRQSQVCAYFVASHFCPDISSSYFPPSSDSHEERERSFFERFVGRGGGRRERAFKNSPPSTSSSPCGRTLFKHKVKIFWGVDCRGN